MIFPIYLAFRRSREKYIVQSVIFGNVIRIIGGIKLPSQTAAIAFRRLLQYVSKLNMRIGKEPVTS